MSSNLAGCANLSKALEEARWESTPPPAPPGAWRPTAEPRRTSCRICCAAVARNAIFSATALCRGRRFFTTSSASANTQERKRRSGRNCPSHYASGWCGARPAAAVLDSRSGKTGERKRKKPRNLVATSHTRRVMIGDAAPAWPGRARVSPTSPSSRRWPARSRRRNPPERNGSPPPSSRSALASCGRG